MCHYAVHYEVERLNTGSPQPIRKEAVYRIDLFKAGSTSLYAVYVETRGGTLT